MKPWRSVAVPHRDIREGRFDESVFAASLSDVVNGRGPLEYRDAASFFRQTYPTQGLVNLLAAVVGRLAGTGPGEPVIQIQTPFGGGKTHALVALYHLFGDTPASGDVVERVLEKSKARGIPPGRVVTFDGTAADPLGGKTPWGELAAQLGRYDLLREHDQRRQAPGKDLLHRVLGDTPALILMDELAEYAAKARNYRGQVMAFFQELTETVKVLPHCALVVTLPSSAPYGEEGERALGELQRIFGRVEAIYTPVEGAEVYEVIRRRLFENLGQLSEETPEARQMAADIGNVAEDYWQMYQRLGEDVPSEAREPAYRERMRLAYPFHPQLIDTLYERWSTFPTFQRTRGVLRLLAQVVADLYGREHPAPLVQCAHLNLADSQIRREFLKHIGNQYEGVVAADIVDSNAKAQRLDRELGSEYARFGVASGLATAIFFGSFAGGERRGINVAGLRLALLREGIPPAIVGDALQRLQDELWYVHVEGGLYQFRSQPNLNRVILEREEAVNDRDIAAEVRARLDRLAGGEMKVTLYPNEPGDVPDNRDLKLALLSADYAGRAPHTTQFASALLDKTSTAFRAYRNTLLVLAPDTGELSTARRQVRRCLALRSIQADKGLLRTMSEEDRQTVTSKLREAEGAIDGHLLSAYRYVGRASGEGVVWLDMGLPAAGERGPLARRVWEFLRGQDMLLERLGPRHVLEKAFAGDETEKPLGDVYEAFLRYPHLPMLESQGVLHRAVAQGVREGVFGVRLGERLYFREGVPEALLDVECAVVRPEKAEREKQPPPTPPPSPGPWPGPPPPGPGTTPPPARGPTITRLALRARVPWDKMSDVVRGVLMPLHSEEAALTVEVSVDARSEKGIRKSILENTVRETLRQIGAEVLEERTE